MNFTQKIEESFAAQSMMKTIGATLDSVELGQIIIRSPLLETTKQQHGIAHAAVPFAIGDSAAGYSALTMLPLEQEILTAEMKINLLAPAKGEYLLATGEVVRAGKRLIIVRASVVAIEGKQQQEVAILQGTMIPISTT